MSGWYVGFQLAPPASFPHIICTDEESLQKLGQDSVMIVILILLSCSFGYLARQRPSLLMIRKDRLMSCHDDSSSDDLITTTNINTTAYKEMRQTMGLRPDKLADTLYAVSSVQGSNVFKLVKDLDELTEGIEMLVQEMGKVAERAEDERIKKKNEKGTARGKGGVDDA